MASRKRHQPLNLLVLAVDTLRADHLSCYGYRRLTSPHLDRLASQGVLFERCYAPSVPTTPAYASMLTGLDVMSTRMVALQPKEPLDARIPTLPEVLRRRGYASACIGFSGQEQERRFHGFDLYKNYRSWISWEERPGDKAGKLNEQALPWLDEMARSGQPFLLFLRHMDPHSPYLPPAPFERMFYSGNETDPAHLQTARSMEPVFGFAPFAEFFRSWMPPGLTDAEYVIAQYDGAIAYMDACIAQLLTRLEELNIAEQTIVMLTGDHGESLLEHECYFDHHGLYEPTIHVPLVIRAPGRLPAGARVPGYVTQPDFMPTLLDLLGQQKLISKLSFDGRSVLPLVRGERATNYSALYLTECTWMRKRGWRTPEWKLIEALEPDFHHKPPRELYNLTDDPLELHNLADEEPAVVQLLHDRIERWVEKRVLETGHPDPITEYFIGTEKKIGSVRAARDMQARSRRDGQDGQAPDAKAPGGQGARARRGAAATGKRPGETAKTKQETD